MHIVYQVIAVKYRRIYRRKNSFIFRTVCIVLAILIGILLTDAKLRPAIYELATIEAHAEAVRTVHNAVEELLSDKNEAYSDIVSLSRDENGSITGITTDIVKLNLFKAKVTNAVDGAFLQKRSAEVSVALGTATGITFFSGMGPYIDVKMGMTSSTRTDFENIFESAGINQTRHSVMLIVKTQVILTLTGRRVTRNIETSFCVAQTVIVGSVPDVMVE